MIADYIKQARIANAPFAVDGEFCIDEHIVQTLFRAALENNGDYADLYFEYNMSNSYSFREEHVKTIGQGISMGLGVRVLNGDTTGYAYTEEFSLEAMKQTAKTAGQIASGNKDVSPLVIKPRSLPDYYNVPQISNDQPINEKVALLHEADKAARAYDSRIANVEISFSESLKEMLLFTSDGVMSADRRPMIRFGVQVVAEQNDKRQGGSSGGGGRLGMEYFSQDNTSAHWHGREAARVALAMLDAREAPAGEMEVVLGPADSGILLHEAVGHGLEADFNRKETSNYSGKIGSRVASDLCTVVDNGTIANSRGSINVDDEGNLSKENTLIENGTLVGYMHDRISAKHFNVDSTGNGRRESFQCTPMPRMTNTSLLPGDSSPDEILSSVKYGVFAKRFSGGQVNISNGDFVFSLTESYLIEDGKITAPLKGVNLTGNGPDALCHVSMVGNDYQLSDGLWTCGKDGQSVPVGVGTPTVKLSKLVVGGTGNE